MPSKPPVNQLDLLGALAEHPPPHMFASQCRDPDADSHLAVPPGATLGFDSLDALGLVTLGAQLSAIAEAHAKQLATALARDGASCGMVKRTLARDAALAHARLRVLEGLQGQAFARWGEDPNAPFHAEALRRLVATEHRRMLDSLEALRRMERGPTPVVKIARAAIVVNK
jgi:hypothetical protein